jgi:MFS family permease
VRVWPQGGLWRHPDFLRLWSGQTVSQFGTQVSQLAIPLAAILVLEASAFEVALLSTVEFLPFLFFTLPAGVWVDRLPRRPILILGDVGRAAALLSVPLAYGLDALTIWQLYGVGFAVGTLTVFFDVAYQSYLPSLVERNQLVQGNSLLEISRTGGQVAGPGIGGFLVGALTAPYAILLDAVSFASSAVLLSRIRTEEPRVEPVERPSMRRELSEGLRYLVRHRYWRAMAITTGGSNFFWMVCGSILLVYAVRSLGMSPELIGLVLTLGSLGGLAGALLAGRLSRRFGVGPTIVGASVLFGPPLVLVPLAPQSSPVPVLVLAFAVSTAGGTIYNITALSLMQTLTPERLLGRLNASRRFVVWGTIPLGSLIGGVLASQIGLRPTLWVGAIGACFCFLPVALSPLRHIGAMPTEPEADPPLGGAPLPAGVRLDA